jgi:FMN phosphatase YigB (HAD superfamily)
MKKAIIFDLDNCLAPATAVGDELFEPAFDAIRKANRGALCEHLLQQAFKDIWRHPLDWVARHYGFSNEMSTAAWSIFSKIEVSRPMRGYEDLDVLGELPVQRFLVTSGFRRLQESKVKALGLHRQFSAIFIDAIDEQGRLGKLGLFQSILEKFHLRPADVLIVGDNPISEIEAGNQLGIETVQTLRPGVPRACNARFYIQSLAELKKILDDKES